MANNGRTKRPTMKGKGREIFFESPNAKTSNPLDLQTPEHQIPLERSTFYIYPDHHEQLDGLKTRLRSRLRQRGFKRSRVDKSELVRMAIDMLLEKEEEDLLRHLMVQPPQHG